jgi:hypothetical protein
MWIKVAEQTVGELFLFREDFQTWDRITGDAEHFSVIVTKISTTVTNCAQFTRAGSRESEWVEHHNHILFSVEIRERNFLTELIGQSEFWGAIADT